MLRLCKVPWTLLFRDTLLEVGAVVDQVQQSSQIPDFNLFTSFRIRVPTWAAGSATYKLRFGFTTTEASVALQGINFAAVAAVNASDYRTVIYDIAAAAPNVPGNPLAILPPKVSLLVTTLGAADMLAEVWYSCLMVP
jgi:hypothetical protein